MRPPSSSNSICRRASNSMARSMNRKELRFFSSQRVPSGSPGRRTETVASQRNDPSCMLPSPMPIQMTSACSARAYAIASFAPRKSGSDTISSSGVPARLRSMPLMPRKSSWSDLPASDAGKSLHEDFRGMSGIDLNRAGTPLLEIVSEPDLRGAKEAIAYARALHALVIWIGIGDGNMQEGSFRCDATVSVRRPGEPLGTRCELKNLNSFRFMERAIEFEARRQIELLEDGGRIEQETRLYDPERDETRSMRTKEEAHDYRYFPDPDLLPLVVTEEQF